MAWHCDRCLKGYLARPTECFTRIGASKNYGCLGNIVPDREAKVLEDSTRSEAVREVTEAAIEKSERGTSLVWREIALNTLHRLCKARPGGTITADDVWIALEQNANDMPREPSALGPVMRAGKKAGWMTATNRTIESVRPTQHCKPLRIWESTF